LAEKQGFGANYLPFYFVVFLFFGICVGVRPCIAAITVDPNLPKKSCLKTYRRFFVVLDLWHNEGMKVENNWKTKGKTDKRAQPNALLLNQDNRTEANARNEVKCSFRDRESGPDTLVALASFCANLGMSGWRWICAPHYDLPKNRETSVLSR
jgi:hypothetical protein